MRIIVLLFVLWVSSTSLYAQLISVTNITELDDAIDNAQPGDIIEMEDGIWLDTPICFRC
jgi:hypothetical protein